MSDRLACSLPPTHLGALLDPGAVQHELLVRLPRVPPQLVQAGLEEGEALGAALVHHHVRHLGVQRRGHHRALLVLLVMS
jgi:hypothetical protein